MTRKLMTVALAAPLLCTGCIGPFARTANYQDYSAIAVRFVTAPQPMEYATDEYGGETQLVVDSAYSGFANVADPADPNGWHGEMYHVALWGDQYSGQDVTYQAATLAPGAYTFAVFDNPNSTVMQGWLDIHNTGSDVADFLSRWKEAIPRYKRQLAYDFELNGRTGDTQPEVFESFTEQLRAFDELARQIDAAISEELRAQTESQRRMRDFLRQSEILLIPGTDDLFHQTTLPAFSEEDLDSVRSGNPMTKLVLAADHDNAQWKMRRVNRLYNDLSRCKQVFQQQVERFERKKGLMLLTDHLHNHDQRFVENEMRLQHTLGCIERLDGDMNDLRERRVALAFITELFARDGNFGALDREASQLVSERSVLQPELRRLNLLFEEADEKSVKRVALQRGRRRVMTQMEALDQRLSDLSKARTTLVDMVGFTQVIHRDGDMRLVTATLVGEGLPLQFRRIVERESLMSVRLEAGERVFVPKTSGPSVTFAPIGPAPVFANYQQYGAPSNFWQDEHSHAQHEEVDRFGHTQEAHSASNAPFEFAGDTLAGEEGHGMHEHPWSQDQSEVQSANEPEPAWDHVHDWQANETESAFQGQAEVRFANRPEPTPGDENCADADDKDKCCREMPLLFKIFVPPCWFVGDGN